MNCYYSELTGLYWIWKNDHEAEYVGTCHYRRYLLNEQEKIFTKRELEEKLRSYDLITTKRVHLNNSYYYGFSANHNIHALDVTGEVIKEKYPAYYDTFVRLVNGPETYFGNMFVTSKKHFDDYCSWLFTIFFEVQKRIDLETDADEYHRRVFGFISEFLLLVWTTVNQLRVFECKVGMIRDPRVERADSRVSGKKRCCGSKKIFYGLPEKAPGCFDGSVGYYRGAAPLYADHWNGRSGIAADRALLLGKRVQPAGADQRIFRPESNRWTLPSGAGERRRCCIY